MASKKTKTALLNIESEIFIMRGQQVLLDSTLSSLFGVTAKALNQALIGNLERFPADFAFQLAANEVAHVRSQIPSRGSVRGRPWVFTEHGVAILSGVLRSPNVASVAVEILRAFVRQRESVVIPSELTEKIRRIHKRAMVRDRQNDKTLDAIRKRMDSFTETPRADSVSTCPTRQNQSLKRI